MVNKPPVQLTIPIPRVQVAPAVDDCRAEGGFSEMQNIRMTTPIAIPPMQTVNTPMQIAGSRLQIVENVTLHQGEHGPPSVRPNYILHDDDNEQQHGYNTRSRTTSIMQEAMLACIDITKPKFELLAAKMSSRKFPMTWFCKMANSVLGEQGKLLEYRHLIANPKTWATWTYSYGNELGHLAQGMPS